MAAVQISRLAVAIVLARLLSPHDYGLAGMALVFMSLVLGLADMSLGAGLVQRATITEADRSTVFWTTAAMGVLLTAAGVLVSGPIASFYGEPRVKPLFMVLSVSFLLTALQATQGAILQREMRFKVLNVRLAVAAVISGAVAIAAAAMGAGPWALIVQQITLSGVSVVLLWSFSPWRPRLVFSFASLRDLGGFGFFLLGSWMLDYANRNADNILVGRFLGSAALGAYSVAYNVMTVPLGRLIVPLYNTLFPAYARWQDDPNRLREVWLRVLRLVTSVLAPVMLVMIVVAPDFVHVVLGSRWAAATKVLQVLAFVGLVQSLAILGRPMLLALDRTRTVFRLTVLDAVLTLPAFGIGLRWGINGVAACYAVATMPSQLLLFARCARTVDSSLGAVFASIRAPFLAAVAAAGVCWLGRNAIVTLHTPAGVRLVAVAATASLVYVSLVWLCARDVIETAQTLLVTRVGPLVKTRMLGTRIGSAVPIERA